jgi:hypothetical protein
MGEFEPAFQFRIISNTGAALVSEGFAAGSFFAIVPAVSNFMGAAYRVFIPAQVPDLFIAFGPGTVAL